MLTQVSKVLSKESQESFNKRFKYILKKVVPNVEYTDFQANNIKRFLETAYKRNKSICLAGLPSTSKTTLFYVLQKSICPSTGYNTSLGEFEIVSAAQIVSEFSADGHQSFKKYDRMNICIDDFGSGEPYVFHKGTKYLVFGELIEHRYSILYKRMCLTHISTNLAPDKSLAGGYTGTYDIKDFLGDRGYSRFKQTFEVISMGFMTENIIDYRAKGYPIPYFGYLFDWSAYVEHMPKDTEKIMEGVLLYAKKEFKDNGVFNDYGSALFKHLFAKQDSVLMKIISEKKESIIELAKSSLLNENKKIAERTPFSLIDMREKISEVKRQEQGVFSDDELKPVIRQLYINEYLKTVCQ